MNLENNFLVVELCDNDFGHKLSKAVRDLVDDFGGVDFCPILAKKYIVESVVAQCKLHDIVQGNEGHDVREYLERGIRVTFRDKLPTYDMEGAMPKDDDGGSVYYDINLDMVFQF